MEAAARVFAGELARATRGIHHQGEDCLLTPAGACVHLVYLVGALTAQSGDARTAVTARVADPTGVFLVRATAREPEMLAALAAIAPPAFVAVLGYAEGGRKEPTVRPLSVAQVDRAVRDRWLVRTADRTAARLEALRARLRGEGDDPLADEAIAVYAVTQAMIEELGAMATRALEVLPAADMADRSPGVDLAAVLLARLEAGGRDGVPMDDLVALGAKEGFSKVEVEEALACLLEEGDCYMPRRGLIRIA